MCVGLGSAVTVSILRVILCVTSPVCLVQSEPFNGQGTMPSGGYNAFTQAAVSGVGLASRQPCEIKKKIKHLYAPGT